MSTTSAATPRSGRSARGLAGLAVAVACALLAIWLAPRLRTGHHQIDLAVYRGGGRLWLDGADLYRTLIPVGDIWLPFTYPPLAAATFAPLAAIGADPAAAVLYASSLAALAGTVVLVLGRLRPGLPPLTIAILTALATGGAVFLEPVAETLSFGQVNLILMFLVAADLLVDRPWWPRGLLIGLAAAVKLTPAAFVLYFLVNRELRAALTATATAVVATAVGFVLAWSDSLDYWFGDVLRRTDRIGTPWFSANQSLTGVLERFRADGAAASALWLLGTLTVLALAVIGMRRLLADGRAPEAIVVNALAVLVCSPVSWSHHWVWIVPALVIAVDALLRGVRPRLLAPAIVVVTAVFVLGPHWYVPHRGGSELSWTWWQQPIGNAYLVIALLTLILGATSHRPPRATPGAASGCGDRPR